VNQTLGVLRVTLGLGQKKNNKTTLLLAMISIPLATRATPFESRTKPE